MFVSGSAIHEESLYRTFHECFYARFFFLAKRFQRRRFLEIDQSETIIACSGHVCQRIGTKSAIGIEDLPGMLPTEFQFIWKSGFRGEEIVYINQPMRNKNVLWWACLLADLN